MRVFTFISGVRVPNPPSPPPPIIWTCESINPGKHAFPFPFILLIVIKSSGTFTLSYIPSILSPAKTIVFIPKYLG